MLDALDIFTEVKRTIWVLTETFSLAHPD